MGSNNVSQSLLTAWETVRTFSVRDFLVDRLRKYAETPEDVKRRERQEKYGNNGALMGDEFISEAEQAKSIDELSRKLDTYHQRPPIGGKDSEYDKGYHDVIAINRRRIAAGPNAKPQDWWASAKGLPKQPTQ